MYMSGCGCGCEEKPIQSGCGCSIIDRDNTTVTHEGNDIVVSSPFYRVVSTDGTVGVTTNTTASPNETVFDLSKPCCPDRLVAVAPECTTGGTIKDIIKVDTSGPLTWTQNGCNNWQLGFNSSLLNNKDEKVKRKSSCTPVFGDQLLTAGTGIKIEDVGCKGRISVTDKQWIRPIRRSRVESDITTIYAHNPLGSTPNNGRFCITGQGSWFVDGGTNDMSVTAQDFYGEDIGDGLSTGAGQMVGRVCQKTGYYDVWMTASFGVSWGADAARVTLASDIPGKEVLLNVGFSNANDWTLNEFQTVETPDGEDLRVRNGQGTRDLVLIQEGQVIYGLFGRMTTNISGNSTGTTTTPPPGGWQNGEMKVYATPFGFNPGSVGNDDVGNPGQGTFWGVAWHCDEDGDARYFKE